MSHDIVSAVHTGAQDALGLPMRIGVKVTHLKCAPRRKQGGHRRSRSKKRKELSKDMISGKVSASA